MFLVGIAGGSGSGKTTFAKKMTQKIPPSHSSKVILLHQDSYYLASPPAHLRVHGAPNFDHPEAFDSALLKDHLKKLKEGKSVDVPIYDYHTSRRTSEVMTVGPCNA